MHFCRCLLSLPAFTLLSKTERPFLPFRMRQSRQRPLTKQLVSLLPAVCQYTSSGYRKACETLQALPDTVHGSKRVFPAAASQKKDEETVFSHSRHKICPPQGTLQQKGRLLYRSF